MEWYLTWNTVVLLAAFLYTIEQCLGSEAQDRLINELFLSRDYDAMSRPVKTLNETVIINFSLTLNILVFVSDQDQVMKTNGYMGLNWQDDRLIWDPVTHGGVTCLRLPVDKVWQPDIALTSTVDEHYLPNYQSNVLIYSSGNVYWVPPFIFKSGCDTNPHYFPFDKQLCVMVFRSVTYNAQEVDFKLVDPHSKMELKDYSEQPSGSWDIVGVPLQILYRMNYRKHGPSPDVSVQLDLLVARKSQFYVITFLLPCVCIAFLTVFIFYLPTASGEKLCLAISILFSIVVFLLILIEIVPPSDSLPLMTKFLVFTFVCNLVSVIITTVSVNWNYRNPKTHSMAPWIKYVFLEVLPKYVGMPRPIKTEKKKLFVPAVQPALTMQKSSLKFRGSNGSKQASVRFTLDDPVDDARAGLIGSTAPTPRYPSYGVIAAAASNYGFSVSRDSTNSAAAKELFQLGQYLAQFPGYVEALANIAYIASNMEEQDEESDVADDWKFIVLVIDRLLLIVFFIGNAIGSLSILLNSPHLFTPLPIP